MILLVGTMVLIPAGLSIIQSLFDWSPGASSAFVGLGNYEELLTSSRLQEIAANQLIFVLGAPLWAGAPLLVAVLLYERVPFPGLFRAIFFFPALLSPVTNGILFRALLRPSGTLNAMLDSVGLGGLASSWIDDPLLVKPVLIVIVTWFTMGFGVVIYSAALSTVPPELLEAAELDGATWLQRIRFVLLPRIIPMFVLNFIFSIATAFQLFPYTYLLTSGGPGYASTTLDFDIYQNAIRFGYFGLAAAESVLLLIVLVVVVLIAARVARRLWVA